MLISDPQLRQKRSIEKQEKILQWLAGEVWTTTEIIADLLDVSRQAAWKTLVKMESKSFVKRSDITLFGTRKLRIWGITSHGIAFSMNDYEDFIDLPTFEPSRISLSTVPHNISLQKARLQAEQLGWNKWIRGERFGFRVENRPDALVVDSGGRKVAVELERTIKTRKRYRQIMGSHLKQIKEGKWDFVQYLSPDVAMVSRLEHIFRSIDYVVIAGQRANVMDKHHKKFKLKLIDEWPEA